MINTQGTTTGRISSYRANMTEVERSHNHNGHTPAGAACEVANSQTAPVRTADDKARNIWTRPVLDHGFVRLRNISGPTRRVTTVTEDEEDFQVLDFDADDTDPANTARMSFDQTDSGRTREADLKLAEYLMKNKHTTPFEMVEVWLEMKLPIFVARQFVRHRTVSINEVSGRYVTLPAEWYIPEIVGGKPVDAKQGQSEGLDEVIQNDFRRTLHMMCEASYNIYLHQIERGVAAEHARMLLHLNHYTHWIWKQDLHNMMHFLMLRDHSHAQAEARAYACAIDQLLRAVLPNCMALYDKYRRMPG